MTGKHEFDTTKIPWDVFHHAIEVAIKYGAENVLITGKGEPILYQDQIAQYLVTIAPSMKHFTRIELQTSGDGMSIEDFSRNLVKWRKCGLDLVALSLYHHTDEKNDELFCPASGHREPMEAKIKAIKDAGLKLRLTFVMMNGYIDSPDEIKKCLDLAAGVGAFQTTFRSVGMPKESKNPDVEQFVEQHLLSIEQEIPIKEYFDTNGHACDTLPFGGTIYEIFGQNACLTTCLDQCNNHDDLRNLIFFPDGTLSTSWEYPRGTAIL